MVSRNPNYQIPSNLEERHTKLEIRHNQISIISMILAIIFSVWNVGQQLSLNDQKAKIDELPTDIQTMTLVEKMIDDLTGNVENREIALSALYGVLILEKDTKDNLKYSKMLIEISDTILHNNWIKLEQNKDQQTYASVSRKSLKILENLGEYENQEFAKERWEYWENKIASKGQPSKTNKEIESTKINDFCFIFQDIYGYLV